MQRIEPLGPLSPPQPRQLTFGKLPRRRNGPLSSLLQIALSFQVPPHLPISDRSHRRMFRAQVTSFAKLSHLLQEARRHHGAKSRLDPAVKHGALERRDRKLADLYAGERGSARLLQPCEGLSGHSIHL